MRGSIDVASI